MIPPKVRYLNQEKEVGVLACRSRAGALLDVVLGNVYTLLKTRWCENSSETDSGRSRSTSPCCLEIVGTVFGGRWQREADYKLCSYRNVSFRSEF